MGLLDDAIRDHLELKRRRGADPAEVERAEREALGPVRRHAEDPSDPALAGDAVEADGDLDYEDDGDWEEPVAEAPGEGSRWTDDFDEPAPSIGGQVSEADYEDPESPPPATGRAGEDTVEHEAAPSGPPPDEEREDVLEETPEFLQDAPDHDRLWFEQKPPRDFNFDG